MASKIGTSYFRRAIVDLIPLQAVRQLRDIADIFYNTSVEILEAKKRALREDDRALATQIGLEGKDVISILCAIPFTPHHIPLTRPIFSEGEYESFGRR